MNGGGSKIKKVAGRLIRQHFQMRRVPAVSYLDVVARRVARGSANASRLLYSVLLCAYVEDDVIVVELLL